MEITVGGTRLRIVEGDIAEQDTEAVVTAAHWDLRGGQGTDGSIHHKAGSELLAACAEIGGCPIGGAVITPGFNLRARYVIHAVGPVYETGDEYEQELLASAYERGLTVAAEHGLRTIAFPSISTGAFNYPMRQAAPIALRAVVTFLRQQPDAFDEVRLVMYPREQTAALGIYEHALSDLLTVAP